MLERTLLAAALTVLVALPGPASAQDDVTKAQEEAHKSVDRMKGLDEKTREQIKKGVDKQAAELPPTAKLQCYYPTEGGKDGKYMFSTRKPIRPQNIYGGQKEALIYVAADPEVYPFGTRFTLEQYPGLTFVVKDATKSTVGNSVDVACSSGTAINLASAVLDVEKLGKARGPAMRRWERNPDGKPGRGHGGGGGR